jgi:hypothetical protein
LQKRKIVEPGSTIFLFGGFYRDLFGLLRRLDAGGADENLVAVDAPGLEIDVLAALGGDVRVAAADAREESAFAVVALSGHIGGWLLVGGYGFMRTVEPKYTRNSFFLQGRGLGRA